MGLGTNVKRMAGMGMGIGLKLIGVGKNGKLKPFPHISSLNSGTVPLNSPGDSTLQ